MKLSNLIFVVFFSYIRTRCVKENIQVNSLFDFSLHNSHPGFNRFISYLIPIYPSLNGDKIVMEVLKEYTRHGRFPTVSLSKPANLPPRSLAETFKTRRGKGSLARIKEMVM